MILRISLLSFYWSRVKYQREADLKLLARLSLNDLNCTT